MTGGYGDKFHRADIQGLRAISAFTIMVFHIWLNRISGGVDLFFLISGFLIASSIFGEYEREGRFDIVRFWARICGRILPSAVLVLTLTAVATVLIVPPPLWAVGLHEFIASVMQLENWQLYRESVEYLNRDDPPSQFQQFWALSVQFQFYVLAPLLALGLFPVVRRTGSWKPMILVFAVGAVASLIWSIYFTAAWPERAYFSTFTRLWEFFIGVCLALAYPLLARLRLGAGLRTVLYVSSVALFLLVAALVPASLAYPGWIAIGPILAGTMFIAAGAAPLGPNPAFRFLSSRPMGFLGRLAFTIYLWHWPLLVLTQHQLESNTVGIAMGLGIIAAAVILAMLTHFLVEGPAVRLLGRLRPTAALAVCVSASVALMLGGLGLRQIMVGAAQAAQREAVTPLKGDHVVPEMVNVRPALPHFVLSIFDRPEGLTDCWGGRACVYGDPDAEFTVAIVGASHAAHWVPVFDRAGRRHGFKVVTVIAADRTEDILASMKPDVVVTTSTKTGAAFPEASRADLDEWVPADRVELWRRLTDNGVPVIAIRDNPRFIPYQNACVWNRPGAQDGCSILRSAIFSPVNPADVYEARLPGFHSVDLTDLTCTDTRCPAVINGYLVYFDRLHFSDSYMRHVAEAAMDEIYRQAPGVLPGER